MCNKGVHLLMIEFLCYQNARYNNKKKGTVLFAVNKNPVNRTDLKSMRTRTVWKKGKL